MSIYLIKMNGHPNCAFTDIIESKTKIITLNSHRDNADVQLVLFQIFHLGIIIL